MRLKTLAATLACAAVSMMGAAAAQGGAATETWNFYDCTGPDSTPSSFSATRASASFGNALQVEGGGTFVALYAYNEDLGAYNTPVISTGKTATATVKCSTIGPKLGYHLTTWGFFAS